MAYFTSTVGRPSTELFSRRSEFYGRYVRDIVNPLGATGATQTVDTGTDPTAGGDGGEQRFSTWSAQ